MSRAQFTVAISTDEEAAASKRMVIYAFSAQINLFTSFFLKHFCGVAEMAANDLARTKFNTHGIKHGQLSRFKVSIFYLSLL